ncbi:histidine--tRNA ligase [Peribacillus psychrosaccharolyticus]|uniref:Histidine--tRNA ligase n=3 Tax=Peribacillus psychrosaccharolyticus TaxID=1407 RepID=A0A974S2I8_PERPY|nr:histidine--tRNA ligase [Peribacillus psychrosaccharolyticus]QQT02742.1 histidine--tRNA ligase [Peribacillus psychrosaccharolyticus]
MAYQNVKGTQDFLPEDEAVRSKVRRVLEDIFLVYGCRPLETPILNFKELMTSKYSGGAEIVKEMYSLRDQGQRELSLRYDLTIPFAKVVAMNPDIRMPFKRYEIGKVFRDGPIKAGRYREFTQCDVDVVGVESQAAEAELMQMAVLVFRELKLDITISYNNRKVMAGMLEVMGVADRDIAGVTLTLDKIKKIGIVGVSEELLMKGINQSSIERIKNWLQVEADIDLSYLEQYIEQNEQLRQGVEEVKELENLLTYLNLGKVCIFNPFLARGLEIYTGTVYEIFLRNGTITSSIGSGGRYDNAIGGLIGSGESYSTVGLSFGLDVIFAAMKVQPLESAIEIDYYIIPIQTQKESLKVAAVFRQKGFRVEVDLTNRKVGKALERANKMRISAVIIIGETEVNNNQVMIKNLQTGEERVESFSFN